MTPKVSIEQLVYGIYFFNARKSLYNNKYVDTQYTYVYCSLLLTFYIYGVTTHSIHSHLAKPWELFKFVLLSDHTSPTIKVFAYWVLDAWQCSDKVTYELGSRHQF